jgi:hypothetical protein
MENVTQVHGITKEEFFGMFQLLVEKIDKLSKETPKSKMHSVKELARHCGVVELTVRNWIDQGKIKAKTIGHRIFIEEGEFQRALTEVKSLKYQRS